MPKLQMICETCRSTAVVHDAWAEWCVETQDWVLRNTFDMAFCDNCYGETNIEEVEYDEERDALGFYKNEE